MMTAYKFVVQHDIVVTVTPYCNLSNKLDFLFIEHKIRNRLHLRNCIQMFSYGTICNYCLIIHVYRVYSTI